MGQSNFATHLLEVFVSWTAPVAMIVLIFFLIKDVKNVMSGNGSVGKIVVKVLVIFLIVGIMFAATGFNNFGNIFKGVVDDVVTEENIPQVGR